MADLGHSAGPPPPDPSWQTRAEHVWVTRQAVGHERFPGVLIAWRRKRGRSNEWEGWVIYVDPGVPAHGSGPTVTQGWVEAARIVRVGQ